ncbi:MAG: hypothetical protein JO317_04835, partial [Verrucomicrobiae bacterium]|nr:hypothetical protein [Verrucomicrobiae bacterium]
ADAEVTYRVVDLPFGSGGLHNELRPSLLLELEEESTNDGAHRAGYYVEGGPTIEMMSMNGNRFSVFFHGVKNSGDEFRMSNDEGVFAGVKATTFQDTPQPNHYDWDFEGARWIPRMRAVNELCGSFDGSLNKIEFRLDAFEWKTFDQIWTVYTDYEHRQNWLSNFDNTSYSVNPGLKTYIEPNEWLAVLTDGQHLVPFVEYSHRSDHALDPKDPLRFTSANTTGHGYLRRQSIDNFQGGFQTLGWNNPNYRAEKYQKVSSFVNQFDWRLTAGYAVNEPRQRDQPPASAGLNWDIASIEGFVVYAQGIVGIGEANPDYIAELGVKRPGGNVFLRYESYGLPARLEGRQHPLYAGIGMQL